MSAADRRGLPLPGNLLGSELAGTAVLVLASLTNVQLRRPGWPTSLSDDPIRIRAARPNLFVKIPGTPGGLFAIEEAVFADIPAKVTLLFSREHGVAAAAWLPLGCRIADSTNAFLGGFRLCDSKGTPP